MEEAEDAVTSSLSADYGHQAKFLLIFWNHDQELSTGSHGFTVITGFTGLKAKMFSLTLSQCHPTTVSLTHPTTLSVSTSHHAHIVTLSSFHPPMVPLSHPPTILTESHSHPLFVSPSHPLIIPPSYSLDITGIDRATVLH